MARALLLAIGTGTAALLALLAYAGSNTSGHTGIDPYTALFVFVPVGMVGLLAAIVAKGRTRIRGVVSACVGLAGIGLLVYLDWSNALLPYEEWVRRGMP